GQAVEQVAAQQVPDEQVAVVAALGLDRGDQFRQGRAQGNDGESDQRLGDAEVAGGAGRAGDDELRAGDGTGQAEYRPQGHGQHDTRQHHPGAFRGQVVWSAARHHQPVAVTPAAPTAATRAYPTTPGWGWSGPAMPANRAGTDQGKYWP